MNPKAQTERQTYFDVMCEANCYLQPIQHSSILSFNTYTYANLPDQIQLAKVTI